jgi:hypothetical protein
MEGPAVNAHDDMWHGGQHYVRRNGKWYRVRERDDIPPEPKK